MAAATVSVDAATRAHVQSVGVALRQRRAQVTRAMRDLITARIPELDGDRRLIDLLDASIEGNVDTMLSALEHGLSVSRFQPPAASFEHARRLAQRGVAVNALIRSYRLGQQHMLEAAYAVCFAGAVDPAVSTASYEAVVVATFDYIDWISQRVIAVYDEERARWLAERDSVRAARVDDVLSGAIPDSADAEAAIRYRLGGQHLGLVLWRDDGPRSPRPGQTAPFAATVSLLAARLAGEVPTLVVARDAGSAWAWIGVPEGFALDIARVNEVLRTAPGGPAVRLSAGTVQAGIEGFRRSHREARAARRVVLVGGSRAAAVSHAEPGLSVAALLSCDLEATRAWVASTLRGLATDDEHHALLRETVRVLLQHDGSYPAAGAAMRLHRNSVRYRVANAEKILGTPIHGDRQNIDLALTACHWLGPAVLAGPDDDPNPRGWVGGETAG